MSPNGQFLFVANTPDNRLEVFLIGDAGLTLVMSVDVGMEPVSVAARDNEVWVVNHLSDNISIVDLHDILQAGFIKGEWTTKEDLIGPTVPFGEFEEEEDDPN